MSEKVENRDPWDSPAYRFWSKSDQQVMIKNNAEISVAKTSKCMPKRDNLESKTMPKHVKHLCKK